MKSAIRHELVTLLFIFAVTILVFWQTGGNGTFSNGQISPGSFPRLAAGAMGLFAVLRALFLMTGAVSLAAEEAPTFNWALTKRPIAVVVLMGAYVWLFSVLPFFVLTFIFLLAVFFVFGIRPWVYLVFQALLITTVLYVLFTKLLQVAV